MTNRTLGIAVATQRAQVAADRRCYATAQAFLDIAEALVDGRDGALLALSDYANLQSARERAADIFGDNDAGNFARVNWMRRESEIVAAARSHAHDADWTDYESETLQRLATALKVEDSLHLATALRRFEDAVSRLVALAEEREETR